MLEIAKQIFYLENVNFLGNPNVNLKMELLIEKRVTMFLYVKNGASEQDLYILN